ncbi:MAG TPA: diguanylate cyclase [Herbaspirillum sp.]|jgi:diguanylate cyclase (GGDEF)-like protein/PAS domain S-box-containing protein|nr:diguanylate cyclase [Herbaspirillum sp.]
MNTFAARLAASYRTGWRIPANFSLGLRASLLIGFGIILGFLAFLGVLAFMGERSTIADFNKLLTVDMKMDDVGTDSMIAMMKARRYEKDFLLMYREFGFNEAKSRYVTLLQANLTDARQLLVEMGSLSGDPETIQQAQRTTQAIDHYENSFLSVVALYGQLGFIDTGLEGKFRDNAHQIEALLLAAPKERQLLVDLLSMRRREKDYILRGRDFDSRATRQAIAQFKTDVTSAAMASEQKAKLISLADAYASQFEQYVQISDQIALEKRSYLAAVQAIEPDLEALLDGALAKNEKARNAITRKSAQTEIIIEVIGMLVIILGIAVAWTVSRRTTTAIGKTIQFAERITAGDLRTQTDYKGRDEFSVLGRALNHMASSLQEAVLVQQHRAAELEGMNAELERRVLARTADLEKSEERFRKLAELSSDWYWEQDENFAFTKMSYNMAIISRVPDDFYIGKTRWELPIEMTEEEWAAHKAVLNAHQTFTDFEYKVQIEKDRPLWFSISGEPVFDANGKFSGYRGVGKQITERKRIEEIIKHRSLHDVLTGLPNRALLQDRLAQALTYAARYSHIIWVVFIDLDGFKHINDTMGHKAGDMVLKEIALRLQSLIRESDTASRLGGDEFVLILQDHMDFEEIQGAIERIMKMVSQPMTVDEQQVCLGCSIGLAAYPADGTDANTLVEHADAAMYRAKQNGRNNFQFYDPSVRALPHSGRTFTL